MSVHPIEAESYRLLARRVDLSGWRALEAAVVARIIHATADVEYATTTVIGEDAVEAGVEAVRAGAPVIADVEMTRHGLSGVDAVCGLAEARIAPPVGSTRAAAGLQAAARRYPYGAIVVVGCAPTALGEVLRLHKSGEFAPALVIGMPVGFVGAAEAKAFLRASPLAVTAVSNVGDKGGSAAAAAAFNAIVRLAHA